MTTQTHMSVFIGRFQPPHKAHIETITRALEFSNKVLVLIGSAFKPSDTRNPFLHHQRKEMILSCFDDDSAKRLIFDYISDHPYNDLAWVKNVQTAIDKAYYDNFGWQDKQDITLIGHHKDESSYYLDLFPSYKQAEMENIYGLDSTTIRELYFQGSDAWKNGNMKRVAQFVPLPVMLYLNQFIKRQFYAQLVKEFEFLKTYKLQWSQAPYPPVFVTADAVVSCLGHVLLVQRKATPGEGLWALPGGFLNPFETVEECAARELEEETRIKVPPARLRGSIRKEKRYDHPGRSLRGRTITTAFHFDLFGERSLPKVRGSDDAAKAKWFPLNELVRLQDKMYEDHYHIVTDILGLG
jgi:bifunctional NMN adenylyltransferase/nudix hydrolase